MATSTFIILILDVLLKRGLLHAIESAIQLNLTTYPPCTHACFVPELLLGWAVLTPIVFLLQSHINGSLRRWRGSSRYRYQSVTTKASELTKMPTQRTFSYPDTLEFNFFDPDSIPSMMATHADTVFTAVQALASEFGFQVDNSRNQAEHLLMLLSNNVLEGESGGLGPATRLHARMFSNYKKWCDRVGSPPMFAKRLAGKAYHSLIEDMLVFLLIWGEAANLKHMPESICFLYHKVMQEHISRQGRSTPTLYPGHFLDMVITPMYEVIAPALANRGDHATKKIYDDFNEFFWSPLCLAYHIHDPMSLDDMEDTEVKFSKATTHVAHGMQEASKTYLEKRSWFHPLLSFHRVFEWHVVTFTLLAVWGFACRLLWPWPFTLQVASSVFWQITLMNIIWTSLEVWAVYPSALNSTSSTQAYLLRLSGGLLILVYQSLYYHWSFRTDTPNPGELRNAGDANFWWWQYIWLSLISQSFYFLQSLMCWVPSVVSIIMTWNNDLIQAILNICYPLSQVYVGKKVHVSQANVFGYIVFWLTLLFFKLWFGYVYVVNPVTEPSLQMYDDYMNYQEIPFAKALALITVWWFPHFLVYIIDLQIWYSVWSAVVGGFHALVERQGAIRDTRSLRSHFMRAPLAFCQKLMPMESPVGVRPNIVPSTTSLVGLQEAKPKHKKPVPKLHTRAASSADFMRLTAFQAAPDEDGDIEEENQSPETTKQRFMDELDVRTQRWVVFARVWNEIIYRLRDSDHMSNSERDIYLFSYFEWLSKPVYLPLFQTAGCVETAVYAFKSTMNGLHGESDGLKKLDLIATFKASLDVTSHEAISEVWELVSWLLHKLLGPVHSADTSKLIDALTQWSENDDIFSRFHADNLHVIVVQIANIINALKNCMVKRKKLPVVTPEVLKKSQESQVEQSQETSQAVIKTASGSSMKKSISTGFLQALTEMNSNDHIPKATTTEGKAKAFAKLQPFRKNFTVIDNVRDKIRDELRNLLNGLKTALRVKNVNGLVYPQCQELVDRITFVMSVESGFMWSDTYASIQIDELVKDPRAPSVLCKSYGLLHLRQSEIELGSLEARRRLNFFVNSLFMDMPLTVPLRFSKEYTCITPFYGEDVLLSKADLESKNSDGVTTLLYLQTLYKKDWMNFLERLGLTNEELIYSKKYLQQTRMWASLRAQTLYRTVEGIMCTEAAIRLYADIENYTLQEKEVLAKMKFNYVVACQIYGQMKKNLDHKADDIEFLLTRFPNLRVAYIDSVRVNREGDMTYYSVLIKHDTNTSIDSPKMKEVYRIKLPGNPVLGEGKPENQNHAIVFTRGRYLQAIDMNQDGYFEEALKMRNVLEEFDAGYAILGLREHIFTGSVSSVANYMALQETSFVTLGQRVLTRPLHIRQHYGHPDLFDKMFVMTEGGMSKASRGINLSEDVFAGFNATIRGHSVGFKEYVQVGKGRDVGLQQTYKFEAKLSQGNAEQSLSRDVDRICDRLDFFRMMSFYYGGIGHYMANTLVMVTLVIIVYALLALAVYGEEGVNGRDLKPEGVFQIVLAGMGLLQTLPLLVVLVVEKGIASAFLEIAFMILSGGPLYFIFHIQTKCYYFQQTLLAGGAMYRPTGRGFVIRHSPFEENYRFFAMSHIYLGFELFIALILFGIYTKSTQYAGLTWSLWLTVVSFLLGPFWFNPLSFEWNKISEDFNSWYTWMIETGGTAEQSWEVWWREENGFFKDLSPSWKAYLFVQKCCLWIFISIGLAGLKFLEDPEEQERVVAVVMVFGAFFFGNWCITKLERHLSYAVRRFMSMLLAAVVLFCTAYLFATHMQYFRYTIAIYYLLSAVCFMCLLCGINVSIIYKFHDYIVCYFLFVLIGFLALFRVNDAHTDSFLFISRC